MKETILISILLGPSQKVSQHFGISHPLATDALGWSFGNMGISRTAGISWENPGKAGILTTGIYHLKLEY
jgi:hypothetical protein